jgi:hypothetical protein
VNQAGIQKKAREVFKRLQQIKELGYADSKFCASNGWFAKFKDRHDIVSKHLHGEAASVLAEDIERARERLRELLKTWNLEDIFNADETALYWRAMPTTSYSVGRKKESGQKVQKDRVTALVCGSAMGEKRKILVIG